jgi:hypothetical protein
VSIASVIRLEKRQVLDVVRFRPGGDVHHRAEQVDRLAQTGVES